MASKAKIFILKENFELLKDAYSIEDRGSTLETLTQKIVAPMLVLDINEVCRMWEYLLKHYYDSISPVRYQILTTV